MHELIDQLHKKFAFWTDIMRIRAEIMREKVRNGLFGLISFLSVRRCAAGEKSYTGKETQEES
ncbi:hypothetical protein D5078_06330 [Pectobacterium carotovorum]|nr:hypothetical protein D5078_06330 [Pectobacterium carotovorum]